MHRKILIMGLPGSGKTTLATVLAIRLRAVHFNADAVRTHINKDLGFSASDRIEQARRMAWLCDQVVKAGGIAIADFICPTPQTRSAFSESGDAFIIWVDRIQAGRFEDTNRMFVAPSHYDLRVTPEQDVEYWREEAVRRIMPVLDSKRPTAMFIGRYQSFDREQKALIIEGIRRVGQVCIAVRDAARTDPNASLSFEEVRSHIEQILHAYKGRFEIVKLPNISHVFYGADLDHAIDPILPVKAAS